MSTAFLSRPKKRIFGISSPKIPVGKSETSESFEMPEAEEAKV